MPAVEPIRDKEAIRRIKDMLRARPRDYLLFVLGINMALRISDLLALKVKDVVNEDGTPKEAITVREMKTKKRRTIILSEAAREAIWWYVEKVKPKRDDWLFPSSRSPKNHLSRYQAWRLVNRWCRDVGLEGHFGTHTLRKTWGYWARQSGARTELIQEAFGHRSPSITRAYLGIADEEVESLYRKVNL